MKKFYSLILALIGLNIAMPSVAETYRSVVFSRTDGTTLALTVESGMSTIVADGSITMSCDAGVISLPTDEITKWTFSTEPGMDFSTAGIETPATDAVDVIIGTDAITINGLADGAKVMLTGIDGRIAAATAAAAGHANLSTANLHGGIYILTFNNKSIKIALK